MTCQTRGCQGVSWECHGLRGHVLLVGGWVETCVQASCQVEAGCAQGHMLMAACWLVSVVRLHVINCTSGPSWGVHSVSHHGMHAPA